LLEGLEEEWEEKSVIGKERWEGTDDWEGNRRVREDRSDGMRWKGRERKIEERNERKRKRMCIPNRNGMRKGRR